MRPLAPKFALLAVALLLAELAAIPLMPDFAEYDVNDVVLPILPTSVAVAIEQPRTPNYDVPRPGWTRVVRVRVTDATGEPLAGVGLVYQDDGFSSFCNPGMEPDVVARTNAAGLAEFDAPPEAMEITAIWPIEPDRIGVSDSRLRAKAILQADTCTIRMPFGTASGHLRLESGEPIVGGVINACGMPGETAAAATDATGRFVIRIPEGGHVDLSFCAEFVRRNYPGGWQLQCDRWEEMKVAGIADVRAGTRDLLLLTEIYRSDGTLRVVVLDSEDRPASGVLVSGMGPEQFTTHWYRSETGRVELENLMVRPQRIEVRFGWKDDWTGHWLPTATEDVIPEGQEIIIRVASGTVIHGDVRGPSGERVAGAMIRVDLAGKGQPSARSDANGAFSLVLDPAVATWTLRSEWKDTAGETWTAVCFVNTETLGVRHLLSLTNRSE
ncbi:MAG: carboxypeptidase regulatory-like domain-containing protein [Planctomycetes bacterium]|nr:carboxypeptidase regulatory-like domain-containing protein [Planctomycetota bacterium]